MCELDTAIMDGSTSDSVNTELLTKPGRGTTYHQLFPSSQLSPLLAPGLGDHTMPWIFSSELSPWLTDSLAPLRGDTHIAYLFQC